MTYKSGTGRSIIAKAESSWGTAAGTGSAQKYRRTSISLALMKDRYQSNEIRDDYQRVTASTGGQRVEGNIEAELSGGSHQSFFEAALRKAAAAVTDITGVSITVAGAGPTYTLTRGSGNWISDGARVGMVVRATAALATANKNRNLYITALSTTVMTVYPLDGAAMTAEGPIAASTIVVPGKRIIIPSSSHLERSFTIEDLISSAMSRQFLGCEVSTLALDLSPGANAKATFGFLGRSQTLATSAYFSSPTALSTTPLLSGPKGVILIDGAVYTGVTQLTLSLNNGLTTEPVVGSTYAPAVGQGRSSLSGQVTLLIEDNTWLTKLANDTAFELGVYMSEDLSDSDANFMLFHVPNCLPSKADPDDGERLIKVVIPFEAYLMATTTGYDSTTLAVQDSQYA